jgi:hypothetical protein
VSGKASGHKRGRRRGAVPAGDIVAEVLRSAGAMDAVREHRLVTRWSDIVGERVAARAWPDGLSKGVLYVRVANAAWMQELSFLRDALADKANALVADGGPALVTSVRLHVGARRDADASGDDVIAALAARRRPRAVPRPRAPADAAARARIAAETAGVGDAELRDIILALRTRLGL